MARPKDPDAKQCLLEAARDLFAKAGLVSTRVEDITRASGLSKGAFYLHFKSKEDIFAELVAELDRQVLSIDRRRLEAVTHFFETNGPLVHRDFELRTARYTEWIELEASFDLEAMDLLWVHRDVVVALLEGSAGSRFQGMLWSILDRDRERICRGLEALRTYGACRQDIPLELVADSIVGAYLMMVRRMAKHATKPDFSQWVHKWQSMFWEGLRGDQASAASHAERTVT